MIQMKIFSVFEPIKRAEALLKKDEAEAIEKILSDIAADATNINDAYVILELLNKVSGKVLESIKETTINNIRNSGDNEGLGVKLQIQGTKQYNYSEDKDWLEMYKKMSIYQDALNKREKDLQDNSLVSHSVNYSIVTTPNN